MKTCLVVCVTLSAVSSVTCCNKHWDSHNQREHTSVHRNVRVSLPGGRLRNHTPLISLLRIKPEADGPSLQQETEEELVEAAM